MIIRPPYYDWLNEISDKKERIRFLIMLVFVFSLPYDLLYSSLALGMLSIATLIDISHEKLKMIPKQFPIFMVVYFLAMAGYFYSLHRSDAGYLLERQVAILLLPLILPMAVQIDEKKGRMLLSALALTTTIAIMYLASRMLYTIVVGLKLPVTESIFSGAFFNHQFSRPLSIHAGYLSIYVSFSIFYLVWLFNTNNSIRRRTCIVLSLLVLFGGLLFLASRNIIITTFFVLLFVYPLFNARNKMRFLIIAVLITIGCSLAVKNIPYLYERFSVELITDMRPIQSGAYVTYHSAEPRIERWKGAWDLIKRSPLFGYGTGDEVAMLRTEYIKRGLYISYFEDFNAHNQYLSYLLKNGLLGLIVFLLAFYFYIITAIRKRHFIYLCFLILLLIGFYTENILDANKGIVFFAFFNSFLGYLALDIHHKAEDAQKTETQNIKTI